MRLTRLKKLIVRQLYFLVSSTILNTVPLDSADTYGIEIVVAVADVTFIITVAM